MDRDISVACRTLSGAVILLLAACSGGEPNANFEQAMKDRADASRSDRYSDMSQVPQMHRYVRLRDEDKPRYAKETSLVFRGTYDSMLKTLDKEPPLAAAAELSQACRAAFADARDFQSTPLAAELQKSAALALIERLDTCRNQAISVERVGDSDLKDRASTLRRFASAGMTLVAISIVGRDDPGTGLGLWAKSEKLAIEDRPGFKLTPRAFY